MSAANNEVRQAGRAALIAKAKELADADYRFEPGCEVLEAVANRHRLPEEDLQEAKSFFWRAMNADPGRGEPEEVSAPEEMAAPMSVEEYNRHTKAFEKGRHKDTTHREPAPQADRKAGASRRGVGRPFIYTWRDAFCAMPAAELTATQRHVLWTVSLHMNPDGTNAYQSQERIAREAALNLRTVRRCLKQLAQLGWLKRERIYKDGPPPRQLVGCRYTAAIPETAKQVAIEKSKAEKSKAEKSKAVPPGGCTPPGEGVGVDSAGGGGCSGTNLGVVGPPTSSSTRTTPGVAAATLAGSSAAPVKQKAEVPQPRQARLRVDWRSALANRDRRNPQPSLIRTRKAEVIYEGDFDAVPEGRLMGGEC